VVSRVWIGGDPQTVLLPVTAADLLPADHLAFRFRALVGGLDLGRFEAAYRADGRGRPPFDPKMMLTLILYCRAKRLISARAVAAACHDDLGARVITGNRYPDRSTIDRFLTVHAGAIKAVLAETLRLGDAEGLVDVWVVAGDGTVLQANAAMANTVDQAELCTQIERLQAQLADAQAVWAEQVAAGQAAAEAAMQPDLWGQTERPCQGRRPGARTAWRRLRTVANLLGARQQALSYLLSHPGAADEQAWTDRLARDQARVAARADQLDQTRAKLTAAADKRAAAVAAGARISGTRPVPVEAHSELRRAVKALQIATARAERTAAAAPAGTRVNTTDPTSRIMPGKKNAGFDQRHNIQALATPGQFILAIATHPCSNDKQALTTLLEAARANLDAAGITAGIGTAIFDSGYASEANFTTHLPVENLLVAVAKHGKQTRQPEPADDNPSTGDPNNKHSQPPASWQIMADRLAQPDNHALYKRRSAIIEPLFAQLFTRFGRTLHARGEQVDVELHLWAITHNLLKIDRHHHRRDN
jgi:transposase